MKLILPLLLVGLVVGVAHAQPAVGTAHDMSAYYGEVCLPCHTPHFSNPQHPDSLWNHQIPAGSSFTMYDQASTTGVVAAVPNTSTLLCLGCHDGVTGLDSYGGFENGGTGTIGTGNLPAANRANLGTDLSVHHPVSIEYAYLTFHGGHGLADPAGLLGHSSPAQVFPTGGFYTGGEAVYTVECGSCHHVHGSSHPYLLSSSNVGSGLCISCHV